MIDDETLFAYLDGEVAQADHARIEAAIAADPALQAIVAEHRMLGADLRQAFSTILAAPLPAQLAHAIAGHAGISNLADARDRRTRRLLPGRFAQWGALAATLVAGAIGGVFFSVSRGPVAERDGQLIASGSLALALDTQLASDPAAHAPVRIGLTFRNKNGAICRSFAAVAADGVACRDGQAWQLRGLLAHDPAGSGAYRMAASPGTAALVDSLIAGEAFDRAQERGALAAHWAPAQGS